MPSRTIKYDSTTATDRLAPIRQWTKHLPPAAFASSRKAKATGKCEANLSVGTSRMHNFWFRVFSEAKGMRSQQFKTCLMPCSSRTSCVAAASAPPMKSQASTREASSSSQAIPPVFLSFTSVDAKCLIASLSMIPELWRRQRAWYARRPSHNVLVTTTPASNWRATPRARALRTTVRSARALARNGASQRRPASAALALRGSTTLRGAMAVQIVALVTPAAALDADDTKDAAAELHGNLLPANPCFHPPWRRVIATSIKRCARSEIHSPLVRCQASTILCKMSWSGFQDTKRKALASNMAASTGCDEH
mmetsp:Transcript_91867/g.230880  ORF Transcript_91867/g.230880 Transcript_91867/m.230880 type:complete len:309 (+) Transcript_91867:360-1286(+)